MKIRFDHPASARLSFQPGDELSVRALTPEMEALLNGARLDGVKVARLVDDDEGETATVSPRGETTTTGRGRRDQRTAHVSE